MQQGRVITGNEHPTGPAPLPAQPVLPVATPVVAPPVLGASRPTPAPVRPPTRGLWKRADAAQVRCVHEGDMLTIERWPEGRGRALVLRGVALGVVGLLGLALLALLAGRGVRRLSSDWEWLVILLACWLLAAGAAAALTAGAWRDLALQASPRGPLLLVGRRRRRWPRERVARIEVYETGRSDRRTRLAELQIDVGEPTLLRLFTDHDKAEVDTFARLLRSALWPAEADPHAPAGPPTAAHAATADPGEPQAADPPLAAPTSLDRLVGLHRTLWRDGRLKPGGLPEPEEEETTHLLGYASSRPGRPKAYSDYRQADLTPVAAASPSNLSPGADGDGADGIGMAVPLAIPVARRAGANGPDRGEAGASGVTDPDAPAPFGSILDYASPRPPKRDALAATRLPAVSDLHLSGDASCATVTETLAGRDMAVWAIVLAVAVLIVLGVQAVALARSNHLAEVIVLSVMFWVELVVLAVVIANTWRRTILIADRGGLRLTFVSLFRREDRSWPRERVGDAQVVAHGPESPADLPLLRPAELRIQIADGPRLHLFTGHYRGELEPIAKVLREALGPGAGGSK